LAIALGGFVPFYEGMTDTQFRRLLAACLILLPLCSFGWLAGGFMSVMCTDQGSILRARQRPPIKLHYPPASPEDWAQHRERCGVFDWGSW
jgi:hypothetical protein